MAVPIPDRLRELASPHYTLERELGRGGMATVYLAWDTKHNRRVAFKVLNPDLGASLGIARFRREVTILAQLYHPHILSVHDSGETAGCLWFTTPYVEGGSLRDRLEQDTRLPVGEAVRIVREMAGALDYAHGRGIIHRDIKPENVLLTEQGRALLADFGIARPLGGAADGVADLTNTGMVVGTRHYMSPEQASGTRTLDARSDVYALGAVCFEMLTGTLPVLGASDLVPALQFEWPDATPSVRPIPSVPEHIDAAVRKALALVPADRWPSAGAFATALERAERTIVATGTTSTPIRRAWLTAVALGLGGLIGAGVLSLWKGGRAAPPPTTATTPVGPLRLAVLPFENVGDSSDAYFADGVTDAVRGKLAGVPGLEVIGSTSSAQYQRTSKTPLEIGRELGVRYLLEGKVSWAKGSGGTSRVRVSPELIDVETSADRWQRPFDAPLTDVFEVQSDIAGQVAQQLEVALTPATAQTIAFRPTADLAAYDAYLRGEALANSVGPDEVRRAVPLFEEAVRRDSTFALAWAALAQMQASAYYDGATYLGDAPRPTLADSANRTSAHALALAPGLASAHTARAAYYLKVRADPMAALVEDSIALVLAPGDATTLTTTGRIEGTLGRWAAAEAHTSTAARLDPRSVVTAYRFGNLELLCRHYAQAASALERAAALEPTNLAVIDGRLLLALNPGDLAGGQAFLRSLPSSVDRNSLVAYLSAYGDLGWVLDSSDAERLLALGVDAFDGDRASRAFALAQQYAFRGDRRRTRAYADTARVAFEAQIAAAPSDAQARVLLGVALAYLGRRDAAIREGERAAALLPIARDAFLGPYIQHQLARIYILVGDRERALNVLKSLLRVPNELTPGMLRIDPNFAPLRGNPRFERLAAGD